MDELNILPDSLEGRALFIVNLLRGGIRTDDDSYDTRLIREDILNTTAKAQQDELIARDNAGLDYDLDLLIVDTVTLVPEEIQHEAPVKLFSIPRPASLQFRGNPLITYLMAPHEPRAWIAASTLNGAILAATRRPYKPGWPAYFIDADKIKVAVPISMGLVRDVFISYAPQNPDEFPDGTKRDIYGDPFLISRKMWAVVWPQVYRNSGGSLIQTSPNRDETNNGADKTVEPS